MTGKDGGILTPTAGGRLRYRELLGKRVVDASGATLGRVADLVAVPRGDRLCVTALLLAPAGLTRRIAFRRAFLGTRRPRRVAWEQVASIDDCIRLRSADPGTDARERSAS